MTIEQQRELDAWIAENEQMEVRVTRGHDQSYAEGYNDGAKAAAKAIRQSNWTWEEYQEHLTGKNIKNI